MIRLAPTYSRGTPEQIMAELDACDRFIGVGSSLTDSLGSTKASAAEPILISGEREYDARLEQLTALLDSIMEYEHRVHPIGPATRWARIRFRWDQAWRWKILPALVGVIIGVLAMWVVMR